MHSVIRETKFHLPKPLGSWILRPALNRVLPEATNAAITLVSAPAGFGKSSLVSQALWQSERSIGWLSLDPSDTEVETFIQLLTTCMRRQNNCLFEQTNELLKRLGSSDIPTLQATLLIEVSALNEPWVIVLDDYQVINNTEIHELLTLLVEHPASLLHFVVITREEPPLPISRWRAAGRLHELRTDDLRFCNDQVKQFIDYQGIDGISAEHIRQLTEKTEGWLAGLQLMVILLKQHQNIDNVIQSFQGSHRFVVDYLADDILAHLPADIQHFLLTTALLPKFCSELFNAISGENQGDYYLQEVERLNCFLVALDNQNRWFRYHPLFKEALLTLRLQRALPEHSIWRKAASWFTENNEPLEAIECLIAANAWPDLADLVEQHWPTLRKTIKETRFQHWMNALPEQTLLQRPLLLAYCAVLVVGHQPQIAERWMTQAMLGWQALNEKPTTTDWICSNTQALQEVPGIVAMAKAYRAGAENDLSALRVHGTEAIALLPQHYCTWRAGAAAMLAFADWHEHNLTGAQSYLRKASRFMADDGELSGAISTLNLMAQVQWAQGDSIATEHSCEQALNLQQSDRPPVPGLADVYVTLAWSSLTRLEPDHARQFLQKADALGDCAKNAETAHLYYLVSAQLLGVEGDFENAENLILEAQSQFLASPAPSILVPEFERVRLVWQRGDMDKAKRLLLAITQSNNAKIEPNDLQLLRTSIQLTENIIANNTPPLRIAKIIHENIQHAHKNGQVPLEQAWQWQQVLYCYSAKQRPALRQQLIKFLGLGNQLYGLFLFAQSPSVVRRAIGPELILVAPETEQTLAKLFSLPKATAHSQHFIQEALSDRECDVLMMLATELSGPQIAEALFVSLNTFRTHCKSIFAKLGVNNRRAAVNRAKDLNLI